MDISVIVPIYLVENYIERSLRSLFEQTKTDGVEFILVNDATPDDSMAIARRVIAEYPHINVNVLEHSVNRGNGAARQTGVETALGDYIIQVDSDDWCEPNMLEDMYVKAIETNADVVYCDWYNNNDRKSHCICKDNLDFLHAAFNWSTEININVTLWNKLIRRSLIVENNINLDLGLRRMVDHIATIRVFYFAEKTVYLSNAYYHYTTDNVNSIVYNLNRYVFTDYGLFFKLVEEFMSNNGCDLFKADILKLSVNCKLTWIRTIRGKRQRGCLKYLPQVDEYILKGNHYPITTKIPYFLITHRLVCLANIIFDLSNRYHRKKRRKG